MNFATNDQPFNKHFNMDFCQRNEKNNKQADANVEKVYQFNELRRKWASIFQC